MFEKNLYHLFSCKVCRQKAAPMFLFIFLTTVLNAQSVRYDSLWSDAKVQERISTGIEQNRKGNFTIILKKGARPLQNVEMQIEQAGHEFLFGTNLFMLNGFAKPEQNQRYEDVFLSLFNHGSIPFYWKTLEPHQGQLRFAKASEPIYRRPPPDAVLEFCKKHNVYAKGHTLVWDNPQWAVPTWLPTDEAAIQSLIDKRIGQIGSRYSKDIPMWDVVNELKNRHHGVTMPMDFANAAFRKADAVFPKNSVLMINETTSLWYDKKREYSHYYLAIENLLLKGARVDAIGLQCHFFHGNQEYKDVLEGATMTPEALFEIMDTYALFGKPLHITEVTIPTIPASAEGEAAQAKVARNLYRIWFSHPAMGSIVWWNMADGTAAPGEDKWRGGFLREDLTAKPSYQMLQKLINEEWKTTVSVKTNNKGEASFRGFYGDYTLRIKVGDRTREQKIKLRKNGPKLIVIN